MLFGLEQWCHNVLLLLLQQHLLWQLLPPLLVVVMVVVVAWELELLQQLLHVGEQEQEQELEEGSR